jgi:hypothetical protein
MARLTAGPTPWRHSFPGSRVQRAAAVMAAVIARTSSSVHTYGGIV